MLGNKKLIAMVCFLLGPVPDSIRSGFVLPSPSRLGLGRDTKSAVPESSAVGCCPSSRGLGFTGQLKPLSSHPRCLTPETERNPHSSQVQSAEKYAVEMRVKGSLERNGSKGCLFGTGNLPDKTLKKKKRNVTSPYLQKEGKVSNTTGTYWQEPMSGVVTDKDMAKIREAKKRVEEVISDFAVSDVVIWAAH